MSNTYIPLIMAAALAGLFSAPLLAAPGAHGPDGQHLDAPANTQRDGLARLPDGSVNVPKMAQRRMEIRTQMAMQSEHAQTVQMNGKVDIDPNAGGRVQAPFQGRVEAPGKGFAVLGQAVRKGDVLAYLLPVSDAISLGSQRAELAEVKAQLTLAQQRVARLQALQGTVPQKEIDAAQAELQSLRGREKALAGSLTGKHALVAPASGVIAKASALNANTASAEVLFAVVEDMSFSDAQRLLAQRERVTFRTVADIRAAVNANVTINNDLITVNSNYFLVEGTAQVEEALIRTRALLERRDQRVFVMWRQ